VSTDQQSTTRQNLVLNEVRIEDPDVFEEHHGLLARCQPLDGAQGVPVVPAQRKARRAYENRVNALTGSAQP
jgi:hypothetical protein